MVLSSGKSLWSVVSGTNVLPSNEVVGEELEAARDHLHDGLLYYKAFSQNDHDSWCSTVKLKDNQKKLVERLGKMLNLASEQTWELFMLYLQQESRFSSAELMSTLSSYRSEARLLHHIYSFYLTDPMHLMSCRTHLLASCARQSHPYQKLFAAYVRDVLDPDKQLGMGLVEELRLVHDCVISHRNRRLQDVFFSSEDPQLNAYKQSALDFAAGNADLPPNAEYHWLAARLGLAKHLLATLLVYYGAPHRHASPQTVYQLIKLAEGDGVCGGVAVGGPGQAALSTLLQEIDALHALLLALLLSPDDEESQSSLSVSEWRDKLDCVLSMMGSRPGHLPALLAWSIARGRDAVANCRASSSTASESTGSLSSLSQSSSSFIQCYSKMAQRALRGGVLAYLHSILSNQAILTDTLLSDLSRSVVYALVCVTLTVLNLDQLLGGDSIATNVLSSLAVSCLECPLAATIFWSEDGGGADLLLPDALAAFPHRPAPLLTLCIALARASRDSCSKVVELLSEVPSITWLLTDRVLAGTCSEVGGAQLVSHSTVELLPGLLLHPHTSGTVLSQDSNSVTGEYVVQWHVPTNAWQVILTVLGTLDGQISGGEAVSEWLVELAEQSLRLVAAVVASDTSHLSSLTHVVQQAFNLFLRLSDVLEPRYSLVCALLEFAAQVAQEKAQKTWDKLDRCKLLPAMPLNSVSKKASEDSVQYYRCGSLRRLVCGHETTIGSYPALRSFCRLLSAALRNSHSSCSTRGGVVFVVREILPVITQQWCYSTATEKVAVLQSVMEVLHHALEPGHVDEDIAVEVAHHLCGRCGGQALSAVLEAGATLEATLDSPPAQWPHSTHAASMAKTAHFALSILHRLVLSHCTGPDNSPLKLRLRDLIAGEKKLSTLGSLGQGPPHLALTVAQFVHHKLDSRLPYLSLRTLTKLAQELGVPLIACLGSEADVIRELLLNRLDAATEDTRVKVAILRLLTAAVSSQPGLLRAFLSPPDNLVHSLTELLDVHTQCCEDQSSVDLLSSVIELVAALWQAGHATAINALRSQQAFWILIVRQLVPPSNYDRSQVFHHTLRLLALEHFIAFKDYEKKMAKGLNDEFALFLREKFSDLTSTITFYCSEHTLTSSQLQLLRDWRDLIAILLSAYSDTMPETVKKLILERSLDALVECFSSPEEAMLRQAAHLLADAVLHAIKNSPKLVVESWVWQSLGRVLEGLRAGILQTPSPTQVRLLSALLIALQQLHDTDPGAAEERSYLVLPALSACVEQHCSLAAASDSGLGSSAAVLQVACCALHSCLLLQPQHVLEQQLQQSHLVPALIHAATFHLQNGKAAASSSSGLPSETGVALLRLLRVFAAAECAGPELSTHGLASSLSLTLSTNLHASIADCLSEVLWCSLTALQRQGPAAVDGCVAIVSVHLTALTDALSTPHLQPDLAIAAATVIASLAPYYRLWIASHSHSYRHLVQAVAACLHVTTHLVRLRGVLKRHIDTRKTSLETPLHDDNKESLSPNEAVLVNKLLRLLLSCLRALRLLGPDLLELLCNPGVDIGEWLPPLLQPSFRRATTAEVAQPNLGTLTALLDLCSTNVMRDKSYKKQSIKATKSKDGEVDQLCGNLMKLCGEEAVLLLVTQAALALLNPSTTSREARDIRTWLNDEMNIFFGTWLGRRPSSAVLSPSSDGSSSRLDKSYLRLMQHLVNTLCHAS